MAGDWIKLHRKSVDSRVFDDDFLWKLWTWCLMNAAWKTSWNHGRQLLPGQLVIGRNDTAEKLSTSPSRVYRGLQRLQEWGQITLKANNHFTVVSICNWKLYQADDVPKRTASEQPADSQRTAAEQPADTPLIDEEIKEGKEGKKGARRSTPKVFEKPSVEDVRLYCQELQNAVDAEHFVDHYESNGWKVGGNPMRDWRAAVRTWAKRNFRVSSNGHATNGLYDELADFVMRGDLNASV